MERQQKEPRTQPAERPAGWYATVTERIGCVYWAAWWGKRPAPSGGAVRAPDAFGRAVNKPAARAEATLAIETRGKRNGRITALAESFARAARTGSAVDDHPEQEPLRRPWPKRPPKPERGAASRGGSYWVARMVAEMLGQEAPPCENFGFGKEPPYPSWWGSVKAGIEEPLAQPAPAASDPDTLALALVTLGLGYDATASDIRQAYRRLALELHPDRGGEVAAFVAVTAAKDLALQLLEDGAG